MVKQKATKFSLMDEVWVQTDCDIERCTDCGFEGKVIEFGTDTVFGRDTLKVGYTNLIGIYRSVWVEKQIVTKI